MIPIEPLDGARQLTHSNLLLAMIGYVEKFASSLSNGVRVHYGGKQT